MGNRQILPDAAIPLPQSAIRIAFTLQGFDRFYLTAGILSIIPLFATKEYHLQGTVLGTVYIDIHIQPSDDDVM